LIAREKLLEECRDELLPTKSLKR